MHPAVDAVFDRYQVPILATSEYPPAGRAWSPEEIAAGLNRVYRAVLLTEQGVPAGLVRDINLVPEVETAELGVVGSMPLPTSSALGSSHGRDWARRAIGLEGAHLISTGDESITVAVLDTGVDTDHPELREAMLPGKDFVDIIDDAGAFIGDYIDA
ncbi:MAG: S8 family serine peptidase, partial [Acidimicrobiales bacterium]|nr:S8 family serine peptidase [Acidimicrobiales bacterium]